MAKMMMLKILRSARQRPSGLIIAIALSAISGCSQPQEDIRIEFVARIGAAAASCSTSNTALSDLRFYVSNPALVGADGARTPLKLAANGRWQQADLALLDFENGEGACANGTPDTNTALLGQVPAGDYRGLEFTVGVPFERNHADPLAARPPLDDSTMHWHWRSGYKFLRVGVATPDDGYWAHIGSAACQGTVQAISGCDAPNRIAVNLPEFAPGDDVVVDLIAFLRIAVEDDDLIGNCSSGPAEMSCIKAFAALGLDFGEHKALADQQLFRTQVR